jgi:hypothetical protein
MTFSSGFWNKIRKAPIEPGMPGGTSINSFPTANSLSARKDCSEVSRRRVEMRRSSGGLRAGSIQSLACHFFDAEAKTNGWLGDRLAVPRAQTEEQKAGPTILLTLEKFVRLAMLNPLC